jgi:hypothetical protein
VEKSINYKNDIYFMLRELLDLKSRRDGKIFTPSQLAKSIAMPHSVIIKLLHPDPTKRVNNPRIDTLIKIIEYFKAEGIMVKNDDPRISTLKSIASFNVGLDSLFKLNCLGAVKEKNMESTKKNIDETLLHYVLKNSHHLYPVTQDSNNDYADFVLGLLKEISAIDTSRENLLKIIDLAISSISSYEETRNKHNHAV